MKFAVPFCTFVVLAGFLAAGLRRDPHHIPSPLIDQPAPAFRLTVLDEPDRTFSPADMLGKVWMLNVWASWCVSCRAEHQVLTALSRSGVVPIVGLDYRDDREKALAFLGRLGNPYNVSIQDVDGRISIDYGVYGVPETYVVDKAGVIRFKQVGPITLDIVEQTILPMVQRLNR